MPKRIQAFARNIEDDAGSRGVGLLTDYAKESDLCQAFTASLPEAWTAYNETAGWDILLARADGLQIGVQAKLKLNAAVLAQAIEHRYDARSPQPDHRAILVPWGKAVAGVAELAGALGVTVLRMEPHQPERARQGFRPFLPGHERYDNDRWFDQCPVARCKLPEYVPDVAAGARAPLQLTTWKIQALKIAVLLEQHGFVTRADFKAIGIDHRRWIAPRPGWLRAIDGRFVPHRLPDFRAQHPVVFDKVKADRDKWAPRQNTML